MSIISKKICLVGDFGVGKTSLMRRFVDRQFSDQYLSTIGVKISRKTVKVVGSRYQESQEVQLLIWDLEGQTKFQSIDRGYLRGSAGAIVVADLSRQDTIERLDRHLDSVYAANPKGVRTIVAFNKSDLLAPGKLATFQQDEIIGRRGLQGNNASSPHNPSSTFRGDLGTTPVRDYFRDLPIYITSAKTGNNVDKIFQHLACLTIDKP